MSEDKTLSDEWSGQRARLCVHLGIEWLGEVDAPVSVGHSTAWFNPRTGEHRVYIVYAEGPDTLWTVGVSHESFAYAIVNALGEALLRKAPYLRAPEASACS